MRKLLTYLSTILVVAVVASLFGFALPAAADTGCANAETGHAANRMYFDQCGNLHINGGSLYANETGGLDALYSYVNFDQANCGGTSTGSYVVWTAPNTSETWQVAAVSASFATASSSGTLDLQVDTGTTAPGSGTTQLTGTLSLAGTANTAVNGTIIASPTTIAAGNRLTFKTGGTLTSLANCNATIALIKRS